MELQSQATHTDTPTNPHTHIHSSMEKVLTAAFIHLSDTEAAKLLIRRQKTDPAAVCSSTGSYGSGYHPVITMGGQRDKLVPCPGHQQVAVTEARDKRCDSTANKNPSQSFINKYQKRTTPIEGVQPINRP